MVGERRLELLMFLVWLIYSQLDSPLSDSPICNAARGLIPVGAGLPQSLTSSLATASRSSP